MNAVDRLLRPRSVAIVGASADTAKLTGRPLAYLEKYGFTGAIYPVNPRVEAIGSHRCYADIAALPDAPDVALVLLGGHRVTDAVAALAARGTTAAIVLASGFGESGEEGRARQEELKRAAGSMRLLGPNTIGLVNVTDRIVLSASNALVTDEIVAGKVALVSQSGGILGSILSRAQAVGLGFSKLIATGNESDLEVADFVDHLAGDEATRVIALYLEGLRKPDAFKVAVARARVAGKPVVAFKVGRSESGARSAVSHTGALAGSDAAYDALFRQFGVIRAERYSDLIDIPLALAAGRALKGNRLAIVTSTGGAASLLADAAGMAGFETPPPDDATAAKLKALAIDGATLDSNPIDVTLAGVKTETFRTILDAVTASPTYDAVAVVLGSSALREPETVGVPLRDCAAHSGKPVMGFVSPDAPSLVRTLNLAGVPTFAAPESCAASRRARRRSGRRRPDGCTVDGRSGRARHAQARPARRSGEQAAVRRLRNSGDARGCCRGHALRGGRRGEDVRRQCRGQDPVARGAAQVGDRRRRGRRRAFGCRAHLRGDGRAVHGLDARAAGRLPRAAVGHQRRGTHSRLHQ